MRPALALTTISLVLMALALILNTPQAHAHGTVWDRLMECEDNDDPRKGGTGWRTNTGNGFYGGLQFSYGTWRAHGGAPFRLRYRQLFPFSRAYQIRVGRRVLRSQGWGAWPACSRRLGLR